MAKGTCTLRDRLQSQVTEPDMIERAYTNPKWLSRVARSFGGITVLVVLASLVMTMATGSPLPWIGGVCVCLITGNVAMWAYKLGRRHRVRE